MNFFKQCLTVATLLLSLQSFAQKVNNPPDHPSFKRLYIGDTVPMESIVFNDVRNYPGGKAKLSDFRGKYIILDFWNRYCSVCIASFPKMERLQQQFRDDIQILLVTGDSKKDFNEILEKSPILKNTKQPIVIGDSLLVKKLFPHSSVPYHVWLDRVGNVVATTYPQETSVENLTRLVTGNPVNLLIKNEIFDNELERDLINQKISLLQVGHGAFQTNLRYYSQIPTARRVNALYGQLLIDSIRNRSQFQFLSAPHYSFFMNYIQGDLGGLGIPGFHDNNGRDRGFRLFNWGMDRMYKLAFVDSGSAIVKIIPEGKAKSLYEGLSDTTNIRRYMINNSYCYESSLPEYSLKNAKKLLQQDLSRFFGMNANIEERPIKCLVFTRLGGSSEIKLWARRQDLSEEAENVSTVDDHNTLLKNTALANLFTTMRIINRGIEDPVIIDETSFTSNEKNKKIDILLKCKLKGTPENIPRMRKELAQYGLGLKEEIRIMKALVLTASL